MREAFLRVFVSLSTVVLSMGMTQVCQHYSHTFEKFKFHFHYESDPTFDRLAQFVCSENEYTLKMVKIVRLVLDLFKKVSFQNSCCCCCCCSVSTGVSQKPDKIQG